jgi:putative ABC transport system permease protein
MPTGVLFRKLLRELRMLFGQIATIGLVLAGGITCFISLRGTYTSLDSARDAYYERHRFADVFARLERAPESLAARIEALPAVRTVETRIAQDVMIPLEGMPRPAFARLLSLPAQREPRTNAVFVRRGRLPEPCSNRSPRPTA